MDDRNDCEQRHLEHGDVRFVFSPHIWIAFVLDTHRRDTWRISNYVVNIGRSICDVWTEWVYLFHRWNRGNSGLNVKYGAENLQYLRFRRSHTFVKKSIYWNEITNFKSGSRTPTWRPSKCHQTVIIRRTNGDIFSSSDYVWWIEWRTQEDAKQHIAKKTEDTKTEVNKWSYQSISKRFGVVYVSPCVE